MNGNNSAPATINPQEVTKEVFIILKELEN